MPTELTLDVNLQNCEDEPIHIPNFIQSHGVLFVLDPSNLNIIQVSDNAEELIGIPSSELLNQPIKYFLNDEQVGFLQGIAERNKVTSVNPFQLHFRGKPFDAIIHRQEKMIVLEVELSQDADPNTFNLFYQRIRLVADQLRLEEDLQSTYELAVNEVRKLTGFDRVMFYKFDHDFNGQIIAESKVEELNPFLEVHFPESDIPVQARELYVKNRIRLIANVNYTPIGLTPKINPIAEGPLNMEFCVLRSVSPIHVEYLNNMGVQASMSISIIVNNQLYGLIACHHQQAIYVPYPTREACDFLGQTISSIISTKVFEERNLSIVRREAAQSKLTRVLNNQNKDDLEFSEKANELLNVVQAKGVAYKLNGKIETFGNVPNFDTIGQCIALAEQKRGDRLIYSTEQVSAELPELSEMSNTVSGVLYVPIAPEENKFIMWFKPEQITDKIWGGKPEKHIKFIDDKNARLSPRKSFQNYVERVKGKSTPWSSVDKESAAQMRVLVFDSYIARAVRLKRQNEELAKQVQLHTSELKTEIELKKQTEKRLLKSLKELKRSNEELQNFAYIASHDLQEPLRKIQAFSGLIKKLSGDKLDDKTADYFERMISASSRMQQMIQDLLSYSRVTTKGAEFEEVDLNQLIDQVQSDLAVLFEQRNVLLQKDDLPVIQGDKMQLSRLFQNLIQNSIKFTKPEQRPEIQIRYKSEGQKLHVISVSDNGIGFEQEYAERIFRLFERLNGRKEFEGTGLGLAIVRKIVERHEGTVAATSAIGEGTTFEIKLPFTH